MTRLRIIAAAIAAPALVFALLACAPGQSMGDACGIAEDQWNAVSAMSEQITSSDDADFAKDSWRSIAQGLRGISTGDDTMDDAATSAADHATKTGSLVDDIVDGVSDASDRYADAVTSFGADYARISLECQGLL